MGKDTSDIRAEIEETRARVGDEADALSYKTDVPARVGDYVDDKKQAVKDKVTGAKASGHWNGVTGGAEREKSGPREGPSGAPPARSRNRRRRARLRGRFAHPVDPRGERANGRDVGPRRGRGKGDGKRRRRAR